MVFSVLCKYVRTPPQPPIDQTSWLKKLDKYRRNGALEVATMIYERFSQLQTLDIRGCHGLQTTVAGIPALRRYFPINHRAMIRVLHSHREDDEALRKQLESLFL